MMLVRVVVGLIFAAWAWAGQDGRVLVGQVSDHGNPVAGAIVTVSNRGFLKSVTTDAEGKFVLQAVPAGRYDLRISAHGYAVNERTVILHSDARLNSIEVNDLVPFDQQTVSVAELATRKLARN